jgi:hypothetical protein
VFATLVQGGYLRVAPEDPGGGPGSQANYQQTGLGHGITCKAHGPLP